MTREWFTAAELAGLPGLPGTDRGLRKTAEREGWQARKREAGKGLEYHLGSLPAVTQAAVLRRELAALNPGGKTGSQETVAPTADVASWGDVFDRKPTSAKQAAHEKALILDQVVRLTQAGHKFTDAIDVVARANDLKPATIKNWWYGKNGKPGCKDYHRQYWAYILASAHVGRVATADCAPAAWEFFKADYLRLEQPAAEACYDRLKAAATANNWQIPSLRTLLRRVKKEVPPAVVVLAREGELAMQKLYPAQQRSVRALKALQWINGDGYQHNVFVRWPDGSVARPKSWVWQDVYSRKILAWRTDLTEHTDVIRLSFGDLVEDFGLPDHITIDNTRAAANKWMTGGTPYRNRYKVQAEDIRGLWPTLGIEVHWTSLTRNAGGKNVGHGQAKPVERAFGWGGLGEYVDKRLEFAGAWCGNSPQSKPENYASSAVPLDAFLAGMTDSIRAWNARLGRDTEVCARRLSFDQAFAESYATALIRRPTPEQRRLWLLPAEARTVQRDGSVTLDAGSAPGAPRNRYWGECLTPLIGHKVVIRFDPDRLHQPVEIFTLDGRHVGTADCQAPVGYGDTQAGREHTRARTQYKRAQRDLLKAQLTIDTLQAAKLLPGTEEPEPPESKLARMFHPPQRAVGSDIEISQQDQEQMAANFAANVIRLAQQGD